MNFEGLGIQNVSEDKEKTSEETEVFSERFFELLANNPTTKEVSQAFSQYFDGVKNDFEDEYREKFKKVWEGKEDDVEEFIEEKMGGFNNLHDELVELVPIADFSEEERTEIMYEAKKVLSLSRARALFSIYANQGELVTRGSSEMLIKRKEQAALQQSLARMILEDSDVYAEIEPRLDKSGAKAFGSLEEYEKIKDGVMSLANASYQYESMGYSVYFAPPQIDTVSAIDMFCVERTGDESLMFEVEAFLRGDFTIEDVHSLPKEKRDRIVGVQVKTQRNLEDVYEGAYDDDSEGFIPLATFFEGMGIPKNSFEDSDTFVNEHTTYRFNRTRGVAGKRSDALILACPRGDEARSISSSGGDISFGDRRKERIVKGVQDARIFFSRDPQLNLAYVFVNNDKKIPVEREKSSFYRG